MILDSSCSMTPDLRDYARTRLASGRAALLGALVAAAALAADGFAHALAVALMALFLVAQFRLWDDLADLPHDRVRSPERVLVRAADLGPFRLVLGASLAAALIVLAAAWSPSHAIGYALLVAALAALYRWLPPGARRARTVLALLKYPAFVLLLASAPATLRAAGCAAALYLLLLLVDLADEARR